MNKITVVDRTSTGSTQEQVRKLNINSARNIEITNYDTNKKTQSEFGDLKARFYDNKKDISIINSDKTKQSNLATVDLSSSKYTVFSKLVQLDGNANDLSEKDLANAKSLIGKNGVSNVRSDAKAGVTTIVFNNGEILRFDVETDAENKTRKANEAKITQQKNQAKKAQQLKKQQEKAVIHEKSKSDFQKFCDKVREKLCNLF